MPGVPRSLVRRALRPSTEALAADKAAKAFKRSAAASRAARADRAASLSGASSSRESRSASCCAWRERFCVWWPRATRALVRAVEEAALEYSYQKRREGFETLKVPDPST